MRNGGANPFGICFDWTCSGRISSSPLQITEIRKDFFINSSFLIPHSSFLYILTESL